jgi:hypothetical protein
VQSAHDEFDIPFGFVPMQMTGSWWMTGLR